MAWNYPLPRQFLFFIHQQKTQNKEWQAQEGLISAQQNEAGHTEQETDDDFILHWRESYGCCVTAFNP